MKRILASLVAVAVFLSLVGSGPVRAQEPLCPTIYLSDAGWSDPAVGEWDPASKTATLTGDLAVQSIAVSGDGITLEGNGHAVTSCDGTGLGVFVSGRTGITVRNLTVRGFWQGIWVEDSAGVTLANNTASGNYSFGIYANHLSTCVLSGNTLQSNGVDGLFVQETSDTTLSGNTIENNGNSGMLVYMCTNLTIAGNVMSGNRFNFVLGGDGPAYYEHDVAADNLVDGKRVYYIKGAAGQVYDGLADAGTIYLVNCDSMTVRNMTLTGGVTGVCLVNTHNSTVENIRTHDVGAVVHLVSSSHNTLAGNESTRDVTGIYLQNASDNVVSDNSVYEAYEGLRVEGGEGNTVTRCTFSSSTGQDVYGNPNYGVRLQSTSGNQVYNNNVFGNAIQVSVEGGGGNVFSLPAPTGGNYWSDWTGPDADGDGFVDRPYVFAGGQDDLPLCLPFGTPDTVAPMTAATLEGTAGDGGWYRSDVQLTLAAADYVGGSGVASTEYRFDDSSWLTYTDPLTFSSEGTTIVYYRSTDNVGNVEEAKDIAVKIDETPPIVTGTPTTEPNAAGWYNHEVTICWTASDALSGLDPSWVPVCMVVGCVDPGPIVVPSITAVDLAGNEATGTMPSIQIDCMAPTIAITVPEPRAALPAGTALEFGAADDLSGLATLTATLDDGSGSVPVTSGAMPGPGVYTLTVSATDVAGNTASEVRDFVVYDPAAGDVSGSGWLDSPAGAYPAAPAMTGKASFHFDASYEAGAAVPGGGTQFQFKAAGLDFVSTGYDWLVVTGAKAQYRGVGTINGAGQYGFLLSTIDGQPDLLRIKIWDAATGTIVYDSQPGAGDSADPTTAIGGGSIIIRQR